MYKSNKLRLTSNPYSWSINVISKSCSIPSKFDKLNPKLILSSLISNEPKIFLTSSINLLISKSISNSFVEIKSLNSLNGKYTFKLSNDTYTVLSIKYNSTLSFISWYVISNTACTFTVSLKSKYTLPSTYRSSYLNDTSKPTCLLFTIVIISFTYGITCKE